MAELLPFKGYPFLLQALSHNMYSNVFWQLLL